MAPELLRGESENTASSDIYALGIMLYEIYSRRDPYAGENADEVLKAVADRMINKRPPVPTNCPAEIQAMSGLDYAQLAQRIIEPFVDDDAGDPEAVGVRRGCVMASMVGRVACRLMKMALRRNAGLLHSGLRHSRTPCGIARS